MTLNLSLVTHYLCADIKNRGSSQKEKYLQSCISNLVDQCQSGQPDASHIALPHFACILLPGSYKETTS